MFKRVLIMVSVLLVAVAMIGCDMETNDERLSREFQDQSSTRAFQAVPPYIPNEYPAREDINWYLRATEKADVWYVYVMGDTDVPLYYFVSDTKPRNICISITAPDRIARGDGYRILRSAPALDGVYYGGAGCDAYYMRDAATGGFIELAGRDYKLMYSTVPLELETDVKRMGPAVAP